MFPNASESPKLLAHGVPPGVDKLIEDFADELDEPLSLLPPPPSPQAIKSANRSDPPSKRVIRFFIFKA
jgi:hypothetical protein